MLLLTEPQIDRVIHNSRAMLLSGLAVITVAMILPRDWRCGLFTGFMLFSLGVYGFAFRKWRSEPGLWMLAVLLMVMLGPCWAYIEFLYWRGLVAPPPGKQGRVVTWENIRSSIDCTIALLLFAINVKLSATVAIENWKRTRAAK